MVLKDFGPFVMTSGIKHLISDSDNSFKIISELNQCVKRHVNGDWGEVCPDDAALNDQAVASGCRILSSYTVQGKKVWIITEAVVDGRRYATTMLLASEY